jgi:hypothetical protein
MSSEIAKKCVAELIGARPGRDQWTVVISYPRCAGGDAGKTRRRFPGGAVSFLSPLRRPRGRTAARTGGCVAWMIGYSLDACEVADFAMAVGGRSPAPIERT